MVNVVDEGVDSQGDVESERDCYCAEREAGAADGAGMGDIPQGYCGTCERCGAPGHTRAHPRRPLTSSWCDEHWRAACEESALPAGFLMAGGLALALLAWWLLFT